MSSGSSWITRCRGRAFRWGERTYVMGILNLTPDSFSGDGLADRVEETVARAQSFAEAGADVIDVGAESTRPGSTPVNAEEELRRLKPVLRRLLETVNLPLSVDTYKSPVAQEVLAAGASMLNDVWGLKQDPRLAELAAERGVPLVLMHNQPESTHQDLIGEVLESLARSIDIARRCGVPREDIIVDPGFGFGKTAEQNLEILRRLHEFKALGQPVLIGTSRKSTIGRVLDLPAEQRLEGTAATVALAIAQGADMVRVHDVREMVRVARMSDAVVRGWKAPG